MAITINYQTYVINVDKSETTFLGINPQTGLEIRQLNVETFGKQLADIQDNSNDVWATTAFEYTGPKDVGGIQLAPVLLILNPYTVTFEDGQYAINLIGGNTNLQDFANVNQVSIRPSNSVGSTYNDAVNDQSYLKARVFINTVTGLPGIAYPLGTPPRPSNNYNDAYIIASSRNFDSYELHSPLLTITNPQIIEGTHWYGKSCDVSKLMINGQNTLGCTFETMSVMGTVDGAIVVTDCKVNNLVNFAGALRNCSLSGTITLDSSFTDIISFVGCFSSVPGTGRPILDFNGINADVQVRGYFGGLTLRNITQNINVSFDGNAATLEIENTCTTGIINVGGITNVLDNSIGSTIFTSRNVGSIVAPKVWSEEIVGDINLDSAARQLELARAYAQIAATNI